MHGPLLSHSRSGSSSSRRWFRFSLSPPSSTASGRLGNLRTLDRVDRDRRHRRRRHDHRHDRRRLRSLGRRGDGDGRGRRRSCFCPTALPRPLPARRSSAASAAYSAARWSPGSAINPFIATLAVMVMVRGAHARLYRYAPRGQPRRQLSWRSAAAIPLPYAFLIMIVVMRRRACAASPPAMGPARLCASAPTSAPPRWRACPSTASRLECYMLSGALAGIAGLLLAARLGTGSPIIGETTPLTAAAAALIGGASLRGGEGSIAGRLRGTSVRRHASSTS